MLLVNYIGYFAAICTTGAYVPQVMRVWRTKSTDDISIKMLLLLMTGLGLWLLFGVWKEEFSIVAANGVTLLLTSIILYFKLSNHRPKEASRRA
jgi:MtN3 and saliva related transmembrane protein